MPDVNLKRAFVNHELVYSPRKLERKLHLSGRSGRGINQSSARNGRPRRIENRWIVGRGVEVCMIKHIDHLRPELRVEPIGASPDWEILQQREIKVHQPRSD